MDSDKNIYGLSEGVFKACQFLGLKFPSEPVDKPQPVPSDYFGDNFELNKAIIKKLCAERKWTRNKFTRIYKIFSKAYSSQKSLNHNKTDLNIYFCDHVLFDIEKFDASSANYLNFEFYRKPLSARQEFITDSYNNLIRIVCNDYLSIGMVNNKARTAEVFANFLHRDFLNTGKCTFKEFKDFVDKHPRFFSKPTGGSFGIGAEIISVESNENLESLFDNLKDKKSLLEEIIIQHASLQAFCPDTVNTLRINTILDVHNVVHILTTSGRFGRMGKVVDNFHGGGFSVVVDKETGIIISDGVNGIHERVKVHPDTGKTFKGFKYPAWEKVCSTVKRMASMIPKLRRIAWDIAINNKGEVLLVEANGDLPGVNIQQVPDDTGRRYLYEPLINELQNYKKAEMQFLGYRVNNLRNISSSYNDNPARQNSNLEYAMSNLIPDCESILDLGCRESKAAKSFCPKGVKYFPVDFKKYNDDEIVICDFNKGEFPDIKADTCFCAFTAEYIAQLPQFLKNMCDAAQKQILMWCRPVDKEINAYYRWRNPFLTDFTEEFLIKTIEQNNFKLNAQYPAPNNSGVILYDFRKTSLT